MRKTLIKFLLLACLASSCDRPAEPGGQKTSMSFSYSVGSMTRSPQGLDEAMAIGEDVLLWVYRTDTVESVYDGIHSTADGKGLLECQEEMYFPEDSSPVGIIAVNGNWTGGRDQYAGSSFPSSFVHQVESDQRTSASGGYALSDLLYACKSSQQSTEDMINLDFVHLLSKFEIILYDKSGYEDKVTDLDIKEVKVPGVMCQAGIYFPNGRDYPSVKAQGNAGDIYVDSNISDGMEIVNECVVVPQFIGENQTLVQVTLANGMVFTCPAGSGGLEVEPGKVYEIRAGISRNGFVDVTVSISGWTDGGGDDDGDAYIF